MLQGKSSGVQVLHLHRRGCHTEGGKIKIKSSSSQLMKVDNNPRVLWAKSVPSNPWRRFEEFLLHFQPRVGFCRWPTSVFDLALRANLDCRYPSHGVDVDVDVDVDVGQPGLQVPLPRGGHLNSILYNNLPRPLPCSLQQVTFYR